MDIAALLRREWRWWPTPLKAANEIDRLRDVIRPFAQATDIECDFMNPPAPYEDGFDVRDAARKAMNGGLS